MRERPILFSAPMIREILADRKTQTRRVVKWPATLSGSFEHLRPDAAPIVGEGHKPIGLSWPYGEPGDRLWVRETWAQEDARDLGLGASQTLYRATATDVEAALVQRWRPSIHMPRWASRLTLEVTSVRVERLHDITEEDARAEGVDWSRPEPYGERWDDDDREDPREVGYPPAGASFARDNFRRLWSSINGPESWEASPWVWVVGFKRVEVPRD